MDGAAALDVDAGEVATTFAERKPKRSLSTYVCLLIAAVFAGVAVLAVLPPFEGFDETAHWSRIQQLADTGVAARYGVDHISKDVDRYDGPYPYAAPGKAGPVVTYQAFRKRPDQTVAHPTRYQQGGQLDWEAQHPPLYYALIAPLYSAVRALNLKGQFLVLRLASWMTAMVGLALAAEGTRRFMTNGAAAAMFIAAWPFLVPEFFPEMARIGNDSLCLLLAGAGWAALLRLISPKGAWGSAAALGVLLGLGLLTKALFLPIVFGTGGLLLLRWALSRTLKRGLELAIVMGVALAVGAGWYVDRFLTTGSLSGSAEFIGFQHQGGTFLGNLAAHFSVLEFLKGFANIVIGFVWGGTWSLAQPHSILLLGPALLIGVPLINWLRHWRDMDWIDGAALAWVVPLTASLFYHVLVLISFTGSGVGTPGHYLHIVAPAIALGVARGWRWRWGGMVLLGWTAVFTAYIWTMELSMFSGCAGKDPVRNHYLLDQGCLIDGRSFAALGHPGLAAASLALCIGLLAFAAFKAPRHLLPKKPSELELVPL
jgi:hypothetical protein